MAHSRRVLGLPALALNWGAWQDTGLAKQQNTVDKLEDQGIKSILPEQAINSLEVLFNQDIAQLGIIPIDWQKWQQANVVKPFYEQVINEDLSKLKASDSKQKSTQQLSLKQELAQLDDDSRSPIIELINQQISQQLSQILGIKDSQQIDPELGFRELGLDSLGSVEFRNKLQSGYELKLSATVIFDYSNIRAIALHIYSLLFPETQTENQDHASKGGADTQEDLTQIKQLSEAEAEEALLAELDNLNLGLE